MNDGKFLLHSFCFKQTYEQVRQIFVDNLNSITQMLPGVSSCQCFFIYLFKSLQVEYNLFRF